MNTRFSLKGPLGVSLIALLLSVVFVLPALGMLLSAAFSRGTGGGETAEVVTTLAARHVEAMKTYQDRFNGRSIFYKPPPKVVYRPPAKVDPPKIERPLELPKPSISATYNGPTPFGFNADGVYFRSSGAGEPPLVIPVGEERKGIRVISIDPPWSVKVAYQGGEYDVTIFNRTMDKLFAAKIDTVIPVPGLRLTQQPTDNSSASELPQDPAVASPQPMRGADRTNPGQRGPRGRSRATPVQQPADAAARAERERSGEADPAEDELADEEGAEESLDDEELEDEEYEESSDDVPPEEEDVQDPQVDETDEELERAEEEQEEAEEGEEPLAWRSIAAKAAGHARQA